MSIVKIVDQAPRAERVNVPAAYRELMGYKERRAVVPVREFSVSAAAMPSTYRGDLPPDKVEVVPPREDLEGARALVVIIDAGTSANGNVYPPSVLAQAAALFEGCKVFYDHKDEERSFRDLAGELRNVRMEGNALVGELFVISADRWLREVVRNSPHLVGLSIFAWVTSEKNDDGTESILSIERVQSVDLVDDPAAGGRVLAVLEGTKTEQTLPPEGGELGQDPPPEAPRAEQEDGGPAAQDPGASDGKEQEDMDKDFTAKLEKQVAEKDAAVAKLEKTVSEQGIKIEKLTADLQKALDAGKKLAEANAKFARKAPLDAFIDENRKDMTKALENAVRLAAKNLPELTAEGLKAIYDEWKGVQEALQKESAPAAGLPSVPVTESAPAGEEDDYDGIEDAESYMNELMGIAE